MHRKAALLAVPLLLVVGCAQEGEPGALAVQAGDAAVSTLRGAPDAVAEAGAARFEMVMAIAFDGESGEMVATGAVDSARQQMQMEIDMGALFDQLSAVGREGVPPGLGGSWQLVADGTTVYVQAPFLEMVGVEGWLSMAADDVGTSAGALGLGAGAFDFTQTLDALRGTVGEPEVVGQEEVRGVATTHYRASMDLAEALEQAPAEQRAQLEAAFGQLESGALGDAEIPIDVWIDDDDLPRRMRLSMDPMLAALDARDGSITMTMELFDYGDDVSIAIPPADEVTPLSEAFGGLGGGAGS
jgi:hypothetical protein